MNFGGPVWHASGRAINWPRAKRIARSALEGVGDASLGEWEEQGHGMTFHLRRRLTAAEQELVGEVRDIRGTAEEQRRLEALFFVAPHLRAVFG